MACRLLLVLKTSACVLLPLFASSAYSCLVEPATDAQLLGAADSAVVGVVVRKELAHGPFVRFWHDHGPTSLGAKPWASMEAIAYVRVTESLKGSQAGLELQVQAHSDEVVSTCPWNNLRGGQNVLLFLKMAKPGEPLRISMGRVPFEPNGVDKARLEVLRGLTRAPGA